jgi:uncharacterized membrane protein YiaA
MLLIAGADVALLPGDRLFWIAAQPGKQKKINGGKTMSFGIYIVGYLILIIGLAIGANMLHLPPKWIGVGILCMVGVAILHGVTVTRQKDASS